jgi:predicted NUDIX family NTP pyrophosphohydrolase
MAARSAGILMYRRNGGALQVLLVHPGGPVWAKKDVGAWSIPKGEYHPDESPWLAALREFEEETGMRPSGTPIQLGEAKQASGKRIIAFALEGDLDIDHIRSNVFETEWPPRSGRMQTFPEIDRAGWFTIPTAYEKIVGGQKAFLDRLLEQVPP